MKKNANRYLFGSFHIKKAMILLMFPLSAMVLFSLAKFSIASISSPGPISAMLSLGAKAPYEADASFLTRAVMRLSMPAMIAPNHAAALPVSKTEVPNDAEAETPTLPLPEDNSQRVTYSTAAETGYTSTDGIYINNQTSLSVDIAKLLSEPLDFSATSDGPLVLIVHTHTSESYTPSEKYNYIPTDTDRTEDTDYNMAAVGRAVYEKLTSAGINVIHDESINDYPSYNGRYNKTLKLIESYTQKYPSIKIVLDIHRDAIVKADGTKIKTVANIDSQNVSQVMLVVGSDQSGLSHPNWRTNMSFALKLQYKMNELYPSLARPINLRKQRFNQHTAPFALIVEVGTNGNTLDEAIEGSKLFADALIAVLSD